MTGLAQSSPPAFLFDLDGTLVDSMPHHRDAWIAWHGRRGSAPPARGGFAATAGVSYQTPL